MKIKIEYIENTSETKWSGWTVTCGDKYADGLTYDEMLGLIAVMTAPEGKPLLKWMKTEEEHKASRVKINEYENLIF